MSYSVLTYIPADEHQAIAAHTSTRDVSTYFQRALDDLGEAGGGTLHVPAGTYWLNATLDNRRFVSIVGDGPSATILKWAATHQGHGLRQLFPLNSATPVHTTIEKLQLISLAGGASSGGGFFDQGGTQVQLIACQIIQFRYGVILDQSELVDIDLCDIAGQAHSCIWLVNGDEAELGNRGAQGGYTNRISVTRCQLNAPVRFLILDDGGYAHSYIDNNYNGGETHIRAAGVQGLVIQGGQFEAAAATNVLITFTRLSGEGVGQCAATLIAGTIIAPTAGNHCIRTFGASAITLAGNFFANSADPEIASVNCADSTQVVSIGNAIHSRGPMFQGVPYDLRWSAEALREGRVAAEAKTIAAGASAFVDIAVSGVEPGDGVEQATSSVDLGDDVTIAARVAAPGRVRVKLTNTGTRPVRAPACTFWVRAMKKRI